MRQSGPALMPNELISCFYLLLGLENVIITLCKIIVGQETDIQLDLHKHQMQKTIIYKIIIR